MSEPTPREKKVERPPKATEQVRRVVPPGRVPHKTQAEKDAERRAAWKKRERQKRLAIGLMVLSVLVLVSHWLRHLGAISMPMDPVVQDIVIGYPTGALLGIFGLYKLP